MPQLELVVSTGLRLHFFIDLNGEWLSASGTLTNKGRMAVHLVKDLMWRADFLGSDQFPTQVSFRADVDEDLAKAVKALLRMRMLRRKDLERLMAMSREQACKELISMFVLEG